MYVDSEIQTLIWNSNSVNSVGYHHSMADYNGHKTDAPSCEIFLQYVVNVGTPQNDGICPLYYGDLRLLQWYNNKVHNCMKVDGILNFIRNVI
jgi:hypothetical protein